MIPAEVFRRCGAETVRDAMKLKGSCVRGRRLLLVGKVGARSESMSKAHKYCFRALIVSFIRPTVYDSSRDLVATTTGRLCSRVVGDFCFPHGELVVSLRAVVPPACKPRLYSCCFIFMFT